MPRPPVTPINIATPREISFENDIKPLLTDHDRDGMLNHCPAQDRFDMHDYDQFKERADLILRMLASRQMPKGGKPWEWDELQVLALWIFQGCKP